MLRKYLLVVTAACFFLITGTNLFAKVVNKTIAIVNGEAIMFSDFEKTVSPILEQYSQAAPEEEKTPAKIKEFKEKLLDQMIDDRILKQEAKKNKITISKREVEEGVQQVKKRFATDSEFKEELKREGLTPVQFEERIEDQLRVMKLIEREIKAKTEQPKEDEIKAFFDKISSKMDGKELGLEKKDEEEMAALAKMLSRAVSEQVRGRHILIQVDKNGSMEKKSAALKKIKDIHKELKSGADFEDLAKKHSDDPGSKGRGGDLGFFSRNDMVPEFEKVAFNLNVGQFSEPVLTDFGYHIIKVEEKKAARKISYDEVKNDLKELLYQKAAQKRYEVWLKDIRSKSSIKINPID